MVFTSGKEQEGFSWQDGFPEYIRQALPRRGFLGGAVVENPPANAEDPGLILGSGRSPGEGNGYPLQYSCLENPMDRGAWQAIVYRGRKSRT